MPLEVLKSNFFLGFFCSAMILISVVFFANPKNQDINWTFPYFSGAANFNTLFKWQISPEDFDIASRLSSEEYRNYKHQRSANLVDDTGNNYGYVLVALLAKKLFPWVGDLWGAVYLQILVHLSICLFLVINIFKTTLQRYGFILLYGANPLVIHFVTFPHYYFWMFIPSFAFILLWRNPKWQPGILLLLTPLLILSILIRSTTLFLCIFFFIFAYYVALSSLRKILAGLCFGIFLSAYGFIMTQSNVSPWHTIFIGIGAYSNTAGINSLSDEEGYAYYFRQTGVKINTHAIDGNWYDPVIKKNYDEVMRNGYIQVFLENPILIIKNSVLNFFLVFSIGYIVASPVGTGLSILLGLMVFSFLLYTRQKIVVVAVSLSAVGFFGYFPPIPAYNFAAYLLIISGMLIGFESKQAEIHQTVKQLLKRLTVTK